MTVYVTKEFARFARKARLQDASLMRAASDVMAGKYDADLGGGVYKQRVAREGGGKSGGFRTIILFKVGRHCFFAHGFAKSGKANVSVKELRTLKRLAAILLDLSNEEIRTAEADGELSEVIDDDGGKQKG